MLNDTAFASDLRMLAANIIASNPETYSEPFLGKPNWEYCEWLTKKDHWGGWYFALYLVEYFPHVGMSPFLDIGK